MLGTFSVKEPSTLLRTIDVATERQWEITRAAFRDVCSGQLEGGLSQVLAQVPAEHQKAVHVAAKGAATHRIMARRTPWVRVQLFIHYLHDLVQRKKRPDQQPGSSENP
jgi:hypothetical protein